jgi:hypothetical protein
MQPSRVHHAPSRAGLAGKYPVVLAERVGTTGHPAGWPVVLRHFPLIVPYLFIASMVCWLTLGDPGVSHNTRSGGMRVLQWVKPGVWGAIIGAIGMMIIGFS